MKQLPADQLKAENVQMDIGNAEIRGGQVDKGAVRLAAILKTTDSPLMLNNAAYALADEDVELTLAESSVRSALDKLTKETEAWTLDEAPNTLKQQSSLLAASWDTLGWILSPRGQAGRS